MIDIFQQILSENTEISRLDGILTAEKGIYDLTGISDAAKPYIIHGITGASMKLVVCQDDDRARSLFEAYRYFEEDALYYPAKDLLFYQSDIHGNTQTSQRLSVICALREQKACTIVVSIGALLNRLAPAKRIYDGIIKLHPGDTLDIGKFSAALVHMGYESVHTCEKPGEFSIRGGIVDVFPLISEHPCRIELWGDEIDSVRFFDEGTQKSISKTDAVEIYPAMELVLRSDEVMRGISAMEADFTPLYEKYRSEMRTEEAFRLKSGFEEKKEALMEGIFMQEAESLLPYFCDHTESLLDYLPKDTCVFYDDIARIYDNAISLSEEYSGSCQRRLEAGLILPGQMELMYSIEETFSALSGHPGVVFSLLEAASSPLRISGSFYLHTTAPGIYRGNIPLLMKDLDKFRRGKRRIIIVLKSRTKARRLADDLLAEGISAFFTEDRSHIVNPGEVMLMAGELAAGLVYPETGVMVFCDQDIFGVTQPGRKRQRSSEASSGQARIRDLSDLSPGDYVVHENHGLGIYQGIEKIEIDHVEKDYIKISYAKGSNLYILASQFDLISKYGSAGDKKPKLSTLGGAEWSRTKSRVRGAVAMVAKELVELYAARQGQNGYVYGPDTIWQKEFEETFPYEETQGQLTAILDVKNDMMSPKIMDRLICGDVGYGKTEIALRAAFKAVQESKQVVYLCPTTILCRQHYNTFVNRMQGYPVNIGMLSRLKSPAENRQTAAKLKSGEIDIVIGTHRALSKDVGYRDLGLLIIDEEQRFGVTHKEKIKQLKKNIDVMSLSATPIPRTLHMSLVGIRDMSLLEEAPLERMPIQTFVFEENDEMVREAISRELSRGGQVYYVCNRIKGIDELAAHIGTLVPDARIAYAHGRMAKDQLETIMEDFINQDTDILVATTIIEIGLDISNVNTIIIHDADKLGLSQLYQLRGRVGRSNRSAYAFLMYKRDKILREVAEKRLAAIREFSDLGSGFKIAMRDLEIRGAGTMLGEAQSGHMEAVGYDLYCKLLSEAVRFQKGEEIEEDFETTVDLAIDAYIPGDYIRDESGKLAMYRRIAFVRTQEEQEELIDELIDRYGDPPRAIMNLLMVSRIRSQAHRVYITELKQKPSRVTMRLLCDAKLNPAGIPELIEAYSPYLRFVPDKEKPAFEMEISANRSLSKKDIPVYIMEFLQRMEELL